MRTFATVLLIALALPSSALSASPYAEFADRPIKALSDKQVTELESGNGMGLAIAAELNGYPGPLHVLELSGQLALDAAQQQATEALFQRMQGEARRLGRELVAAERDLDSAFGEQRIDEAGLSARLERIAALQARLRGVHLAAHLEQARILSREQVKRYVELRGYANGNGDRHHSDHGGHHPSH